MHDVVLSVNGTEWRGWKEVRIRRSIRQISSEFSLKLTDKWSEDMQPRPINEGDASVVKIDDRTVMTGFIDDFTPSYDAQTHSIEVQGRDKTGDLVDCSAPSFQWRGRSLLEGAQVLCEPFGIPVRTTANVSRKFDRLKSDEGESYFDVIETAARIRAVLLMSDGLGGLVIGRAGTERLSGALILGENILGANSRRSMRDRFSKYTVKGQSNNAFTETTSVTASAEDKLVRRFRPKTILAEDGLDIGGCRDRAIWHRNTAFANATSANYTVNGWYLDGELIEPNKLVSVRDPFLKINSDQLISDVSYVIDEKGLRCEITVADPAAFDLKELPEPSDEGAVF